ncbi:hypothetical protein [Streptomyces sp. NBC_01506]|uniref:hypothetical protein n=1 Tax=Streptomyces sp. NBC_01506 TaxID=2903887 RepID=UPI0038670B02
MLPPLFELTDHVHGDTGPLREVFLREIGQATQATECLSKVLFARYHAATLRRDRAGTRAPHEVGRPAKPREGDTKTPGFYGAEATAQRLAGLTEWQRASAVKANPDWAQLPVRVRALRDGKLLYMAVPRMAGLRPFFQLDPDVLDIPAEGRGPTHTRSPANRPQNSRSLSSSMPRSAS